MNQKNQENIRAAARFLVNLANHYNWLNQTRKNDLRFGSQPYNLYHQGFNFVLDLIGIEDKPNINIRHGLVKIFEDNLPASLDDGKKLLELFHKVSVLDEAELKEGMDSARTAEIFFNPDLFFARRGDEND